MNTTSQLDGTPPSSIVYVQATPQTPANLRGDLYEDVDYWMSQYERVTRFNRWGPEQSIWKVYNTPEGTAGTWFENYEASISSWKDFQTKLRRIFASHQRHQRVEDLLQEESKGRTRLSQASSTTLSASRTAPTQTLPKRKSYGA